MSETSGPSAIPWGTLLSAAVILLGAVAAFVTLQNDVGANAEDLAKVEARIENVEGLVGKVRERLVGIETNQKRQGDRLADIESVQREQVGKLAEIGVTLARHSAQLDALGGRFDAFQEALEDRDAILQRILEAVEQRQ